jgi:hypothetical protein
LKTYFLVAAVVLAQTINSFAQVSDTFDIATFQAPQGWTKELSQSSLQIATEDKSKGIYCLITVFKSLPSANNSKEDFSITWNKIVKSYVNVSAAPQMGAPGVENGWDVQNGFAPFEKNGEKGVAMLVTASGFGTMMNVLVLTNTQVYQPEISAFLSSINLKKPAIEDSAKLSPSTSAVSSGYVYAITKFDDGWTSTVGEDWVEVSKGNTKVLIHHPNKQADAYNSVVMEGLKNAWNVLVAPRYSSAGNFEFKPITGWQAIEFAEADMVEKGTGRTVHVVLFKMNYSNGSGRYLEFITPSKSAFEQEFGPYHQNTSGWEKLEKMANYNKFGIGAADLKGKWTNDFSGSLSYVSAYTGASAGTDTHASIENFIFSAGGAYKWDIGVASGYVGSIKFQSMNSAGRVTVPGIWQVTFSNIQGRPRTYAASFTAVKGGRILWLDGRPFGKLQ